MMPAAPSVITRTHHQMTSGHAHTNEEVVPAVRTQVARLTAEAGDRGEAQSAGRCYSFVTRTPQAGFEGWVQAGQDVPGQRQLIEQGGVGGLRGRRLEGVELGLGLFAVVVELAEPVGDPGPHGGRGGVGRVGGELFQAEDLRVLCRVELLDAGRQCGGLGIPVGLGLGVGGGQLSGQQLRAMRAEDVLGEEQAGDLVPLLLGGLDAAGMIGVAGGVAGVGGTVRAAGCGAWKIRFSRSSSR